MATLWETLAWHLPDTCQIRVVCLLKVLPKLEKMLGSFFLSINEDENNSNPCFVSTCCNPLQHGFPSGRKFASLQRELLMI